LSTDSQAGGKTEMPKKRRWLWPLLIVSLGFNLLFVGLVAGRMWMHGGGPGARHRIFTGAVEKLMKDLPEEKRQQAGVLLKRHRATVRKIRKQIREHRSVTKDAVLTDPYDETKVAEALARFRELRTGQHHSMHTMMTGLLKDLTLKEREELLNHIRAGFRHRWRRHRGPNGGPRNGELPPERQ
jgi:uncharacterized membrane protein